MTKRTDRPRGGRHEDVHRLPRDPAAFGGAATTAAAIERLVALNVRFPCFPTKTTPTSQERQEALGFLEAHPMARHQSGNDFVPQGVGLWHGPDVPQSSEAQGHDW
jgi:hypothetical protein